MCVDQSDQPCRVAPCGCCGRRTLLDRKLRSRTGESAKTNRDVDVLISAIDDRLNDIMGGYLSGADPTSPNVSPLYADFTGFPPLLMQVGAYESLLDDTRRVAEKAKDAGVDVTVEIWPEMFHQWQMWAPVLPEGQQAIESIGKFLKKHGGR